VIKSILQPLQASLGTALYQKATLFLKAAKAVTNNGRAVIYNDQKLFVG